MSSGEVPLAGGTHGPVVRVGETVRRLARPQTPAVQALLRHLEQAGCDGAPRALGVDARGREVLSYIPGEVVGQRGAGVPPAFVRADATLEGVARLLRRLHDAAAGFVPPADVAWAFQTGAPRTGDTICHNDVGPWNTVFRDGVPVAFIDWDTAAPAPRTWDVAYAAYRFVPFVPDTICALGGWQQPSERTAAPVLCRLWRGGTRRRAGHDGASPRLDDGDGACARRCGRSDLRRTLAGDHPATAGAQHRLRAWLPALSSRRGATRREHRRVRPRSCTSFCGAVILYNKSYSHIWNGTASIAANETGACAGRCAMARGLALLAAAMIAVGATGCGGGGHTWSSDVQSNFMDSCTNFSSDSYCRCAMVKLEQRYSDADVARVERQMEQTGSLPQSWINVALSCQQYNS